MKKKKSCGSCCQGQKSAPCQASVMKLKACPACGLMFETKFKACPQCSRDSVAAKKKER